MINADNQKKQNIWIYINKIKNEVRIFFAVGTVVTVVTVGTVVNLLETVVNR